MAVTRSFLRCKVSPAPGRCANRRYRRAIQPSGARFFLFRLSLTMSNKLRIVRSQPVATFWGFRKKKKRLKPLLTWLETFSQVFMVAHTGVEPVISALRGRCPGPLDE